MKNKIKQVEKTLGEPIASDFTDYVRRIRNNLIFLSVVAIGICLAGLTLSEDSSFLGLKFEGLQSEYIINALFYLNMYFLVHFLWCATDHMQEWRLRVTGTRVAFITAATLASKDGDYPTDPRQSSLYNWWKDQARKIGSLTEPLDAINAKLADWENKVKKSLEDKDPNRDSVIMSIKHVSEDIAKLENSIKATEETLNSDRIPASLRRFDYWFSLFLRSQNMRWLLIELLLPIFVGLYSIILLLEKL